MLYDWTGVLYVLLHVMGLKYLVAMLHEDSNWCVVCTHGT